MRSFKHLLLAIKVTLFLALGTAAGYYFWKTGFDLEALIGKAENTRPEYFFLAMSFLPLVGFPISAFYLFAGIAFYWPSAVALALGAIAMNLLLSYAITHSLLKKPLEALLTKAGYTLPKIPRNHQIKTIVLIRLMPIAPFFVQNYLLALGGTHFWPYLLLSIVLQGLIGASIILIGQSLLGSGSQVLILGMATLLLSLFFWIKSTWGRTAKNGPSRPR